MWNRLAPYVLRLLDMLNRLALYVLRLWERHDPRPVPEDEAGDDINLCHQMLDEEADSGTKAGDDYDVFLNFRGTDTRKTFADCLYVFMSDKGIRVFRDEEELSPGEKISKIFQAVKSSKIFIPIFSKGYASSKWCLDELACMVESTRRSPEKRIMPIFYDVDPLDVKLGTVLYKRALRRHEKKYGCARVKLWEDALTTVARLSGWHLKDQSHGNVMRDITQEIFRKITTTKRIVPTNLVGINDRIEYIKKKLDCRNTSDVRFVIIYGIGGIGKTTLAKAVFNEIRLQFEGHSFLSKESSSHGGIEEMQRKLVADLFDYSFPKTFDFDNGNNIIRERLPNKRVLLVFDGMDKKDQFMQLAEHYTLCCPGSRIIITTRDKSVFPVIKVEGLKENISTGSRQIFLYEMKEMHFDHAFQLFNKLAFKADSAPSYLYDLSREVVERAGGLPLVVEVMGSHLSSQREVDWTSTLKILSEVPREDVIKKLRISYDALDCRAQQIYLDIAFFFTNKKITNPTYMWKDCGFFPEDKIGVLINKSLIKIVDHDRIWMHDQLRALGKEIVYRQYMSKPEDRSRLWSLKEDSIMGAEDAVALAPRRSGSNFTHNDFANLTNERFVILDGGNFAGNFENVFPALRWLCWRNCPPKLQANIFVLNHLVVLELSGDIATEEWSGWVEIMVTSKLKVLKIAGSKSLVKTPCFSKFTSLERLVLKDCLNLAEIDCSIGNLKQLICLKIKCCPCLRLLPEEIGYLTALRELIFIQGFSVRYLPHSIGNLSLLSRLVLENTGIVELPDTIKGLADLKYLCLANCTALKSLPNAVGELKLLTDLDLSGTTIKELPHSIWNRIDLTLRINSSNIRTQLITEGLPFLEVIDDCWHPLELEVDLQSARMKLAMEVLRYKVLPKIRISYGTLTYGVKQIFLDIACFFVNKKIINAMYVWEACGLYPKVGIDLLINESLIKIVDGDRIWMHYLVRNFGRETVCRENIGKSGDGSKSALPMLAPDMVQANKGTEKVEVIASKKMGHNYYLTRKDYANLGNARFLELDGQNFGGNFKDILPEVRWLCWRNCPPRLQANDFVLNHLVVLKLSGNITIEEWSRWVEIMVANKLKVLSLTGSKSFIKTPCFSEFKILERLVLKDFPCLIEIDQSIGELKQLIYLKIKCCPLLRELPKEIGCLTSLRELILIQACSVCYLPDTIGRLRLLSRLIMEDTGLVQLPNTIKGLVDLDHMCLAKCRSLKSLPDAFGELKSLTHLNLSGTTIEELPLSLWKLEVLTLWIDGSKIETQLLRYRSLLQDLENCLDLEELEPDGPLESARFSVSLLDYPMEIFILEPRTIVAPGFHDHHLLGRCPPKILARLIFSHGDGSSINVAAEVLPWNTGIMSSSQPILYLKNMILMLVSWLEKKLVPKWTHDSARKGEDLLSLEFCNHCMSITSEIREFSDGPLLESFYRFPQLSIAFSMTLHEPGHSDQIGYRMENLDNLTKFSSPILPSANLLLKGPWSGEKLLKYIEMWNSRYEEATQVQGSASRRSSQNRTSRRLRKTREGALRAKMKRNLTWLCLREYLDERLLTDTLSVCSSCNYVLEEACRLLSDSALDVKQKTRLAREFTWVAKWLVGVIDLEITPEERYSQLLNETFALLFCWFWQHSEERSSTEYMYGRWLAPRRRQEPKSGRRSADYKSARSTRSAPLKSPPSSNPLLLAKSSHCNS